MSKIKQTALGGIVSNPVFVLVLGICPLIAVSDRFLNAFGMGVATAFVIVCSNTIISSIRKITPERVRLPIYILIIATFCTLTDLFMQRFMPELHDGIRVFIALIVVNCIVLGRAEGFAGKNTVLSSVVDGVSMGLGFIAAISVLGAVRQFLTDIMLMEIFGSAAGGFLVLGMLMALFNAVYLAVKTRLDSKKINRGAADGNISHNSRRTNHE